MPESCLPAGRGLRKMFCVYILRSKKDNNFYIGKTNNLKRRLYEHNKGLVQSTKSRIPLDLLKIIKCQNEEEALMIEKECKKGYMREKLKKTVN